MTAKVTVTNMLLFIVITLLECDDTINRDCTLELGYKTCRRLGASTQTTKEHKEHQDFHQIPSSPVTVASTIACPELARALARKPTVSLRSWSSDVSSKVKVTSA